MGYPLPPGIQVFNQWGCPIPNPQSTGWHELDELPKVGFSKAFNMIPLSWTSFFPGTWWPISSAMCVSSLSMECSWICWFYISVQCVWGLCNSRDRGMGIHMRGIYDFMKFCKTWLIRSDQRALVLDQSPTITRDSHSHTMDSFDGPTTRLYTWVTSMEPWFFITWQNSHPSGFWSSKFANKILGQMYKTYSNTWWMDGACTKIQHITDQTHPKFSGPNYHISATDRNLPEVFSGIYRFTYNFKPTFRGGPKKKTRVLWWLEGRRTNSTPPLCDHNSRIQGLWLLPRWKNPTAFFGSLRNGEDSLGPGTPHGTCVFWVSKWWEWITVVFSTRTYEMFRTFSFLESTLYLFPV